MAISILFQCQGPLNGLEMPSGWDGWSLLERADWLKAEGLAGDSLEAYAMLETAGMFPREAVPARVRSRRDGEARRFRGSVGSGPARSDAGSDAGVTRVRQGEELDRVGGRDGLPRQEFWWNR